LKEWTSGRTEQALNNEVSEVRLVTPPPWNSHSTSFCFCFLTSSDKRLIMCSTLSTISKSLSWAGYSWETELDHSSLRTFDTVSPAPTSYEAKMLRSLDPFVLASPQLIAIAHNW